jgi:hypothetical protein
VQFSALLIASSGVVFTLPSMTPLHQSVLPGAGRQAAASFAVAGNAAINWRCMMCPQRIKPPAHQTLRVDHARLNTRQSAGPRLMPSSSQSFAMARKSSQALALSSGRRSR